MVIFIVERYITKGFQLTGSIEHALGTVVPSFKHKLDAHRHYYKLNIPTYYFLSLATSSRKTGQLSFFRISYNFCRQQWD